jgi:hypothetical protein
VRSAEPLLAPLPECLAAVDRHFTSAAQISAVNTLIHRRWSSQGLLSIVHVDSDHNPMVQLADLVAPQRLCLAQVRRSDHAVDRGEIRGHPGGRLACREGAVVVRQQKTELPGGHAPQSGESRSTAFLHCQDLRSVSTIEYSINHDSIKRRDGATEPARR